MEPGLKSPSLGGQPGVGMPYSPTYKWWVVFMLWFICFFNYADRQSIFSVFPKLKEEFGFDTVERGWIASYTADVIARHGVLEEGVHYIQKPFSLVSLATIVREVLDGR